MLRGLDDPWTGSVSAWLSNYGITRVSEFDVGSLGTVGAGNHFAELCSVEKIVDETAAAQLGVQASGLYLLGAGYRSPVAKHIFTEYSTVHTGSRGLGSSILSAETTTESNPYIPPDSPHLQEYLTEHDYAVRWAVANRDLVAHRIKQCIMPSSEDAGDGPEAQLDMKKIIDVTHNSVTKHALTVRDTTRELWVHRKGAAPADQGVAPCPGNRGSFSWLLQPTGDGQYNGSAFSFLNEVRLMRSGSTLSRAWGRQALWPECAPYRRKDQQGEFDPDRPRLGCHLRGSRSSDRRAAGGVQRRGMCC